MFRPNRDIRNSAGERSVYHVMARDQLDCQRDAVAADGPGKSRRRSRPRPSGRASSWGERLATAPRGHPKDRVAAPQETLAGGPKFGRGIGRGAGLGFVAETWRASAPVTGWLDEHAGPATMPADRRRRRR